MRATNTFTLGTNRALYIGELPATEWHCHASPVLLIGLSGRFAVHLPDAGIQSCHSVLIDAGVDHVFDPCGERVALIYFEPDSIEARRLRQQFRLDGKVIFDVAMRPVSSASFNRHLGSFDLQTLLRFKVPDSIKLDVRVENSLKLLRAVNDRPVARDTAALAAALSSSRFNHLFRAEAGVSFRSYRIWSQVRSSFFSLAQGTSLTDAALYGAFTDSSHFSRTFRKTFGMSPSTVLKPLEEIVIV
ncbi:helix-turn-helix domain-containing protein [Noviherbaspirillum sp. CPCC 100848]|uniref:Helix-turn-helix domain-containing protein n=1 Tax=Noviherbaspirillum album TaxID=3080276 RepID=A0ABU6J256_9BURK|nr:helix-turn-helix domain-containing protein [Noviherbaspirillum sp. CPCC 100848]MEC4717694.1 helix-turn-helix domain-containing protein [Noviherbaspirillum sp. CPCC 100848]